MRKKQPPVGRKVYEPSPCGLPPGECEWLHDDSISVTVAASGCWIRRQYQTGNGAAGLEGRHPIVQCPGARQEDAPNDNVIRPLTRGADPATDETCARSLPAAPLPPVGLVLIVPSAPEHPKNASAVSPRGCVPGPFMPPIPEPWMTGHFTRYLGRAALPRGWEGP
jgi:hypothetical protein